MAWLEIHQELPEHPKTDALMDETGVERPMAVGYVVMALLWALRYAHDGVIVQKRLGAIARGAGWPGDPVAFAQAMVAAGWWDELGDGWKLHDWEQYAGMLIEKRRKDAERKAGSRSGDAPQDSSRTVHRTPRGQSNGRPSEPRMDGAGTNMTNQHDSTNRTNTTDRTDRVMRASAPAHASEPPAPEDSFIDVPSETLSGVVRGMGSAVPGGAGDVATDFVAPAGPPGVPKGPEVPVSPAVLAALAAVLPAGTLCRPEQVPAMIQGHLRTEYPAAENGHVWTAWHDLGPEGRVAWITEALGRADVAAKPAKDRMRSASRHIGRALHDGFDLLAEDRTGKVVAHPSAAAQPYRPRAGGGRMSNQERNIEALQRAAAAHRAAGGGT